MTEEGVSDEGKMGESQLKSHQLVGQIVCTHRSANQHVMCLKTSSVLKIYY